MSPVVSASSAALGTLASVLPRGLSDAIRGAALTVMPQIDSIVRKFLFRKLY